MALHAATARTAPPYDRLRRILSSKLVSGLAYPHSIDHYLELVAPSLS